MLKRRTSMAALLICSSMLAACGEDTGKKRVASTNREDADDGERKAAREIEARLMADPAAALMTIERRVAERGGLIVLQGGATTWRSGRKRESRRVPLYAMPATTPWYIKCDVDGLEVTLGPWPAGRVNSGEEEESEAAFSAELTHARLTNEQCKAMVPAVGRKLLAMTR